MAINPAANESISLSILKRKVTYAIALPTVRTRLLVDKEKMLFIIERMRVTAFCVMSKTVHRLHAVSHPRVVETGVRAPN